MERYQNTVTQRKETTGKDTGPQFITTKELVGLFLGCSEQVRPRQFKRMKLRRVIEGAEQQKGMEAPLFKREKII